VSKNQLWQGVRLSALWGSGGGKRGSGSRTNSPGGSGGRGVSLALLVAVLVAVVVPWSASAHSAAANNAPSAPTPGVFVPSSLVTAAQANPTETFNVIVQGTESDNTNQVAHQVSNYAARANHHLVDAATNAAAAAQQAQSTAGTLTSQATQDAQDAQQAQAGATTARQHWHNTGQGKARAAAAAAAATQAAQDAAAAQQAAAAAAATAAAAANTATSAQGAITQVAGQILDQQVTNQFTAISGISATLTGQQITNIVQNGSSGLLSITPNAPVVLGPTSAAAAASDPSQSPVPAPVASTPTASTATAAPVASSSSTSATSSSTGGSTSQADDAADGTGSAGNGQSAPTDGSLFSTQLWPYESGSSTLWADDATLASAGAIPSIAIVDSGIDSSLPDFGSRVIDSVNLSTLPDAQTPDDQYGHGTFVAGIAAGSAPGYTGASPDANLVSVKVMGPNGMGLTSDIINAAQWILDNQQKDNIKVANFSLNSTISAPFYDDPLDAAVEQLWFHGITVVTSSGNYGNADGSASGVQFSPGDDPFVITVGSADLNATATTSDDTVPWWSAWGDTGDAFAKPELSAPGRYQVGPVPADATLATERPENVVAPNYMQLSGTSFATAVVSGTVADMLARNPGLTPDQIKGALMLSATPMDPSAGLSGGVGELSAAGAVAVQNPPNPNLALDGFVNSNNGTSQFDPTAWFTAVASDASWNDASWNDASWNDASWNDASWNDASWNDASWNDASWNDASWNDASWNDASWNDASCSDASWNDASWNDASWNDAACNNASINDSAMSDSAVDPSVYTLNASEVTQLEDNAEIAPPLFSLPSLLQTAVSAPAAATTTTTTTTTTTPTTTNGN
jgi:serine protease AprX